MRASLPGAVPYEHVFYGISRLCLACLPADKTPFPVRAKFSLGLPPFLLLWSSCLVAWFVSVCCFLTFSLSGDKIQSVQSVCLSVFWLFSLLLVCWSSRLGSVCLYVWPCPRLLLSWAFSCPGLLLSWASLVLGLLLSWAFSCPEPSLVLALPSMVLISAMFARPSLL